MKLPHKHQNLWCCCSSSRRRSAQPAVYRTHTRCVRWDHTRCSDWTHDDSD